MPTKIDSGELQKLALRLGLIAKDAPKAFAQAISSVSRASKTETKRAAAAIYNAPQGRIDTGLNVSTKPGAVVIRAMRKPLTLKAFKPRQTKNGVLVTVIKSRGRKRIGAGFSPAKFSGVPFLRLGSKQYPIAPIPGPSVADMLNNKGVFSPLQARLFLRARDLLDRRITRALKNRG